MSINTAVLTGNLTRDPSVGVTKTGKDVISFCVAVSDRRKNQDGEWEDYANFIDVDAFDKPYLAEKLAKGVRVGIQGALKYSSWQDSKTGDYRSKVSVVANKVEVFTKPKTDEPQQIALEDDDLPF